MRFYLQFQSLCLKYVQFRLFVNNIGVIGASNSDETEVISRLLSALPEQYRLLQISFASTSVALRDRNIYKNFFRTIPADDIQVEVWVWGCHTLFISQRMPAYENTLTQK